MSKREKSQRYKDIFKEHIYSEITKLRRSKYSKLKRFFLRDCKDFLGSQDVRIKYPQNVLSLLYNFWKSMPSSKKPLD